jgi:hypothetical protein
MPSGEVIVAPTPPETIPAFLRDGHNFPSCCRPVNDLGGIVDPYCPEPVMLKLIVAPAPFRIPSIGSAGSLSPFERLLQGSRTRRQAASRFQTGHAIEAIAAYVAARRAVAGHVGESRYAMTGQN